MLTALLCMTVAAHAATFTGTGTDDQGNTITFTLTEQLTPATLYVAANGSDANNCKSQSAPCQTIAKLNSLTLSRGGSVLFNGGDTFTGNFVPTIDGNGDPNNPLTIGSYGTGRATLVGGGQGETGVINIDGMSGVIVQNLNIRGPADLTKMPRAGIRIGNNTSAVRHNITIQNVDIGGICYFQATQPSPTQQGTDGFEILIAGYPGAGVDTINIFNSKLHGLNGPTSCDDSGIGSFGNGINNVHVKNVEVFNIGGGPAGIPANLVYPPMGDGIGADGWSNSLIEFSTAHDLGANYRYPAAGPAGFLTAHATNVTISRCEAYNIAPSDFTLVQVDFLGFDLDIGTSNSTIDSSYSHDNYNSGFLMFSVGEATWQNNAITNSISQNDQRAGEMGFGAISVNVPGTATVTVQNNTTFNNRVYNGQLYQNSNQGASGVSFIGATISGTISKNIVVTNSDIGGLSWPLNARNFQNPYAPAIDISNNAWFQMSGSFSAFWGNQLYSALASWQAASGKGAGTQTGDPHFSSVGTGPAGYVQTTYPAWGATPQPSYGIF